MHFNHRPPFPLSGAMTPDPSLFASVNVRSSSAASRSPKFPFLRGVNFGYLSKSGYFSSAAAAEEVDRMADSGVEWVSLLVMVMQDAFYSTRVYRDFRFTPSDRDLARIIERMHRKGLKVLLKPAIDCQDSAWRGRINFPEATSEQIQGVRTDYWGPWFSSVTDAMTYYARLAEEFGVEGFTSAQELLGADFETEHWRKLNEAVRGVYRGHLCINACGDLGRLSHPDFLAWASEVDGVGVSYYSGVPAEARTADAIHESLSRDLPAWRELAAKLRRPIYWAECGCRSMSSAHVLPSEYRSPGPYDGELQAEYLEGMLRTFWNESWWGGFQLWKWDEQQDRPHYRQPGGDTGFTIRGKPAEAVMLRWAGRQRG